MTKGKSRESPTSTRQKLLEGQGYALYLSSDRNGDAFEVKLELLNVDEEKPVISLSGSSSPEDPGLTIDFKVSEEDLKELVRKFLKLFGVEGA